MLLPIKPPRAAPRKTDPGRTPRLKPAQFLMEKKMSTNQARETVDHVSKALDSAKTEEDQKNALTNLQNEIEANTKKMNPAEQKDYMTQVTKELEAKNLLPVLAVASAGDGELTKSDLRSDLRHAEREEKRGTVTRQLDKAMLNYLINNYDNGARLVEAKDEEYFTDSKLSRADVTAKLAEFRAARDEQHRKEGNQVKSEQTARALLDGGDKSLFSFIDRNGNDGQLTKKELQDYLNDARNSGSKDGHFSKEKQRTVENILKDWDNRDSGKWMRGGFNGDNSAGEVLTRDGLVKASGKKSEAELGVRPSEPAPKQGDPLPKPGDPKPGTPPKTGEMEIQKGDSYWSISRRILGDKATNAEILAKTKELQQKNENAPLYFDPKHPHKIKV